MMLLLLLYINVSLMLIHESTQLIHSREEIIRIKENRLRIQDSLQRSIQSTRTAKQIMQEQEEAMKSHMKNQNRSIDEFLNCAKTNFKSIRGNSFVKAISQFMKSKTVLGTKDISKNRMHMCDLLVDPYPPDVHEALSHIIDEHENSGVL
ncbi:hypothetical protein KSF78_0009080 [Schistosoma japonicum]|nr:hypothetical protein KSF78_0009080 [Schistosoma japonicum]